MKDVKSLTRDTLKRPLLLSSLGRFLRMSISILSSTLRRYSTLNFNLSSLYR